MTDAKRLPVIQVPVARNGRPGRDENGFGIFRECSTEQAGFALYEPAVGRCATCKFFRLRSENRPNFCPGHWLRIADTDYCSQHEGARP